MTIQAQADFLTEVQQTLRQARDEKSEAKLRKGADMMNSPAFSTLPNDAQEDLSALYAEALFRATGALA